MRAAPSRRALFAFARILCVRSGQYRCLSCLASQKNWVRGGASRQVGLRHTAPLRCLWTNRMSRKEAVEEQHEDDANDQIEHETQVQEMSEEQFLNDPVDIESQLNYEASGPERGMLNELKIVEAGPVRSRERIGALEDALTDVVEGMKAEEDNEDSMDGIASWYQRGRDLDKSSPEAESIKALNEDGDNEGHSILPPTEDRSNTEPGSSINMIPWYLRPQDTDSLIPKIDIQKVTEEKYPDLPLNSPPMLQPLISRLFYDHHLQNIIILDLRNRWPPPVWGTETIMILATARSERQLGSIAAATSKWLKQTVGVIPRTDGLPRKETLVLKRRRLRRKAMLKPGYMATPPKPTTWVSMYTGYHGIVLQLFTEEGRIEYDLEGLWGDARVVDAAELDMKPRKVTPGGFEEDEVVETWRPVSQKKSEADKREGKARKRIEKRQERREAKRRWTRAEKEAAKQERLRERALSATGGEWPPSNLRSTVSGRNPWTMGQRRQFHACQLLVARQGTTKETLMDFKPTEYSRVKLAKPDDVNSTKASWWQKPQLLPEVSDLQLPNEVYEQFLDALRGQSPFAERDDATDLLARTIAIQGNRYKADKLANLAASKDPESLRLLAHFAMLARFTKLFPKAPEDVRRTLFYNFEMEPFLEKGFQWALDFFMRDMPIRPTVHHYHLAMMYYLNLSRIAPRTYPVSRIIDIMLLAMSQGIQIPRSTFHLILNHIATERPFPPVGVRWTNADHRRQLQARLYHMTTIIKHMKSDFGLEYLHDEEVYLALYRASWHNFPTIPEIIRDINSPLPSYPFEFSEMAIRFFADKHIPKSPEFFMLELMTFAHRRRWRSLFKRWSWLVRFGVTRDADLWTVFWGCLARGQHESYIRLALTNQFPEMMDEGEGLKMNRNIGIALNRCLELADPDKLGFEAERKVTGRILEAFPE